MTKIGFLFMLSFALASCGQQNIIKYRGKIFFFEDQKIFNFNLNLKPYFDNVLEMEKTIDKLDEVCKSIVTTRCDKYAKHFRNEMPLIREDIKMINSTLKRKKRSWGAVLGTIGKYGWKIMEKSIVVSGISFLLSNVMSGSEPVVDASTIKVILDNQNTIIKHFNQTNHNNDMIDRKMLEYQELANLLTNMKIDHIEDTDKFRAVLKNDIRSQIFKIIDVNDFLSKINATNEELKPNRTLPNVDIVTLLDLSKMISSKNLTHIKISVEVPILNMKTKDLNELIPLPYNRGEKTVIQNMNSKLYFTGDHNETLIIPNEIFEQCIHLENLTICNSVDLMLMEYPDECMQSILRKKTIKCENKQIQNHNYWIQTSESSIYCFIVEPVQIKISCEDSEKSYNLTKSMEIDYEGCNVYKMVNEIQYNSTSQTTVEIIKPNMQMNLSIYDSIYGNWSYNLTNINQNQIILLKAVEQIQNVTIPLNQRGREGKFLKILRIIGSPLNFLSKMLSLDSIKSFVTVLTIVIVCFWCCCRR